jgi:hypothetical protein
VCIRFTIGFLFLAGISPIIHPQELHVTPITLNICLTTSVLPCSGVWTDSGVNHHPIYMFAYVVCPNLEAAAVLSKRQKSRTLNAMNVPIIVAQSDFETVRNRHRECRVGATIEEGVGN